MGNPNYLNPHFANHVSGRLRIKNRVGNEGVTTERRVQSHGDDSDVYKSMKAAAETAGGSLSDEVILVA
jgi:hypothetical protein